MPANSDQTQPTGFAERPKPEATEQTSTQEIHPSGVRTDEPAAPPTDSPRRDRVWRCGTQTIVATIVFMLLTGIAIPAAAILAMLSGITAFGDQQVLVLSILGALAVLCLACGWRLVLHPRIKINGDQVVIMNPMRTHRLHLDDITQFRPGGDGLVVATRESEVEAWCVQKSTGAIKASRRTRADQVCDELWAIWDEYHRPQAHPDGSVMIRFGRPSEAKLLMELERSASLASLGHIFPPEEFPYPDAAVQQRWQSALTDRSKLTMIAVVDGQPVGYACFDEQTVYHFGVAADHQRQGVGSALLDAVEDEMFADASTPMIELWVLAENDVARTFYREHGWEDGNESRTSEFPPFPTELRMVRRNPRLARRGR